MSNALYVVEHLNAIAWFFQILPYLVRARAHNTHESLQLFYIDATKIGLWFVRCTKGFVRVRIERFDFRLVDVRDEEGLLLRLRIPYCDLFEIQKDIVSSVSFQEFLHMRPSEALRAFIVKQSVTMAEVPEESIWRALLIVQIFYWKLREGGKQGKSILFLRRRPWHDTIVRYGTRYGVTIIAVSAGVNLRQWIRRALSPRRIEYLRTLRSHFYNMKLAWRAWAWQKKFRGAIEPRIGVDYGGHFNLENQQHYSDLFFLQQSGLKESDLLLIFSFSADPLDDQKLALLKKHEMRPIALYPGASVVPEVPIFIPSHHAPPPSLYKKKSGIMRTVEEKWLTRQIEHYKTLRAYWYDVFSSENVKAYVTWYRYDAKHFAITAAMRDAGGVTAIYQRALQPDPSPEIAVCADLMFGYAPADATVERQSGSRIRYHVAIGYLHDYVFPHCKKEAQRIRTLLLAHGARFIVAYFDENSAEDPRWHTGHDFMRVNYAFILEKLLSEPWLGLVLKPKYPSNLRRRLGPVAALLEHALATGRCFLFEKGALHGSYPPAVAALTSDVAMHGHLCAGSAGLEAALTGVPTLLLDREGWHVSPLYRLGVWRVVFRTWDALWSALIEYRKRPEGIPGFGDWSSMINDLDPFRDGRAAERMGTYLKWVLDGLKAGGDRDTVLADAAERYRNVWGEDKVTCVRGV